MKRIIYLTVICLIISSCSHQSNETAANESDEDIVAMDSGTSPLVVQKLNTLPDDPNFVLATDTVSTYGPQSITRNILQDRNGIFWLTTWEGIISYDDKFFTNNTLKDGLSHYHVFSVMEDKSGNLWFGTIAGGMYRYRSGSFTLFTTTDGLAGNSVYSMLQDKSGNIWFGTDGGVSNYDGNSFINYTTKEGLSSNSVFSIIQDKSGKIWVGSNGGIDIYDPSLITSGKPFTTFTNKKESTSFHNIRTMIVDKSGSIWIGSQEGLTRFDPVTGKLSNITKNFVAYIFEDRSGKLWLSVGEVNNTNMILFRYDTASGVFTKITEEKQVFGITQDMSGKIWFGMVNGVCRFDPALSLLPGGKAFTKFKKTDL